MHQLTNNSSFFIINRANTASEESYGGIRSRNVSYLLFLLPHISPYSPTSFYISPLSRSIGVLVGKVSILSGPEFDIWGVVL